MYSRWRERLRHTLGFRLALWYAIIFVFSSLAQIQQELGTLKIK